MGSPSGKPFYNRKGQLTRYALACGYIERCEHLQQTVTLWYEGGVFHVRRYNHMHNKRVYWNTYRALTEARKDYLKSASEIKSLCYIPA